jgi:hypothetical protein
MRRLTVVALVLGLVGVAVYRARVIERCERELAIGRHAGGPRPG